MSSPSIDGSVPRELLRAESAWVKCHMCAKSGPTITDHKHGTLSWLAAAMVCFSGCALGCCLFPFCMTSCSDVTHRCSTCRQELATYKKI